MVPFDMWQTLNAQDINIERFIGLHVMNVVYRTVRDSIYVNEYNQYEKNVLLWSTLFHDIVKRSTPTFQGKDHVHPFLSAKATLEIFQRFGFITLNGLE